MWNWLKSIFAKPRDRSLENFRRYVAELGRTPKQVGLSPLDFARVVDCIHDRQHLLLVAPDGNGVIIDGIIVFVDTCTPTGLPRPLST